MKNIIAAILITLLIICLLDMPYGYYQFIRVAAFVGFAYLSYLERKEKTNPTYFLLFIVGAILFNPFFKIYLGKSIWQIADICYSLILGVYIWQMKKKAVTNNA